MSVESVRDRRRAQTVAEIKEAALDQLAEAGPGGFSLRGVARAVGMTVQSLYHYFDSRDALLTALVADAHNAVADAVQAAADRTRGQVPEERRVAASQAFREWALTHRPAFLLIYGTPVPDFTPSADGGTAAAAARLARPFADVVFDGWSGAQLAAVPLPPGAAELADATPSTVPGVSLPPGAMAWFIELRARMHGLVTLELLGQLWPFNDHGAALFEGAMRRLSAETDAVQRSAARGGPRR